MRVVLDTNVLVSAILSRDTPPDRIIQAWRSGQIDLVTSAPLLLELHNVLTRPKIAKRIKRPQSDVEQFLIDMLDSTLMVAPEIELDVIKGDPADNRFLKAAITGSAEYIVSGDEDLLKLDEYEGVRIVTPARFVAILAAEGP